MNNDPTYIEVNIKNLTFNLNMNEKTAEVMGQSNERNNLFIPRSIIYKNQEFIITSINSQAFSNSKAIKFPPDSELSKIEAAFSYSSIENLTIPSSVTELCDGWCYATPNLTKVKVMPNNKSLLNLNNQLIIGKSDNKSDNYDVILFSRRDITNVTIPFFITIIGSYSFQHSKIQSIFIPHHLTKIGQGAFMDCNSLESIEFSPDSNLHFIESRAFFGTSIKSLSIPSNVSEFKDGWCDSANMITKVEVSPKNPNFMCCDEKLIIGKSDNQSDIFDVLFFVCRDVENVKIPSSIRRIASHAFAATKIENIVIPEKVTQIDDFAFKYCYYLNRVYFEKNSQLKSIGNEVFSWSGIESIAIPKRVAQIHTNAFFNCFKLQIIEIENPEFQIDEKNNFNYLENCIIMLNRKEKKQL